MIDEKDNVTELEEEIDADDGVVQLINEDGDALDFFFVASLPYKDNWYAFFQPAEEMEDIDEDEIVVFRIVEDESGNDTFEPIEDEQLLDEVYEEYVRRHKEYLQEQGIDFDEGCDCEHEHCGCGHEHCDCDDDCDCDGECDGECDCKDDDDDCDCGCHHHH